MGKQRIFLSINIVFFLLAVLSFSVAAEKFQKYVFDKEKFSIDLPAGWKIKQIHANNVVAEATSPFENEFDNFSEEILITSGYAEKNPPSLEKSLEIQLKQITFLYGKSCIYDSGTQTVGGKNFVWVVYGKKDGDLTRRNINYIFVNGKYQYMLWCYALKESFEKYEPIFDAAAKSLTYLE